MRSPEQALALLRRQWQLHVGEWLGGAGEWPLRLPLSIPSERQVSAYWAEFEAWRAAWKACRSGGVSWIERRWPQLGQQAVPEALCVPDANTLAALLGESVRWQRACARYADWVQRWPALAASLQRQFDLLADTDDAEFSRLGDMLTWLEANPQSKLYARQLPVAGMHSKWLDTRTGLMADWLRALRGVSREVDFWQVSGLQREPDRVRIRVLDADLRAHVGGLGDIFAPFDQLATLDLPTRRVFIVENKQTGLAFHEMPGSVVLMARGYAIDRLHELGWLRHAESVYYWGDLDTDGLAILGRLRGHLPQVKSLLMDEQTLLVHRELWVPEPKSHSAETIKHLDPTEQALYRDLRNDRFGVRVRLEQERIAWNFAWPIIAATA